MRGKYAAPAALSDRAEGLFNARGGAGRLDAAVDTASAGQLVNRGDGVLPARVDRGAGAEIAGQREFVVFDIHRDDGGTVVQAGRHQRTQPDAAEAENRHGRSGRRAQRVRHDAGAGGDRASKQDGDVHGHPRGHQDATVFGYHGMLVERRDAAGIDAALAAAVDRTACLHAAALDPAEDDAVAALHLTDPGARVLDITGTLVPQQVRQIRIRAALAPNLHQLAVADTAVGDPDQDLAGLEGRNTDVRFDRQRPVQFTQYGGFHPRLACWALTAYWLRRAASTVSGRVRERPPMMSNNLSQAR